MKGLPNSEVMKEDKMEGYTYLDIKKTGFKQRFRLVLKSKLNGENRITAIHAWAVTVYRYGARILQWKESELKDVDRKSSKQ